jgi:hypothetical protein
MPTKILPASNGSKTSNDMTLEDLESEQPTNMKRIINDGDNKGNFDWGSSKIGEMDVEKNNETNAGSEESSRRKRRVRSKSVDDKTKINLDEYDNVETIGEDQSFKMKSSEFASSMFHAATMGNITILKRQKKKATTAKMEAIRKKKLKQWDNHMSTLKEQISELRDEVKQNELWGQAMDARREELRYAESVDITARKGAPGELMKEKIPKKDTMKPFTGMSLYCFFCFFFCFLRFLF